MKLPVHVRIDDYSLATRMRDSLTLGHYFAFVDAKAETSTGRLARLQVGPKATHRVIPLVGDPFTVVGMRLTPRDRLIDPLGAVVTDRDLYRAEQDTVHLFVAMPMPTPPKGLELIVECNGEPFTARALDLKDGVGMETLSMLLPGSYQAQLSVKGRKIGTPVDFTVAEYALAPLTGRLVSHELDRSNSELRFDLSVESYQVPFDGELDVSLVDGVREVSSTQLKAESKGKYRGRLSMKGDGPFRLQLVSTEDAERVAQVAIPGSRTSERDVTILGELGKERLFSMMPEPGAIPLRGGFLTEGDFLATPLLAEEVVSDRFVLHAKKDLDALTFVVLDLTSGTMRVLDHGDVKTGDAIPVTSESSLCTVFAGCVVDGKPFEGYTSFFRPSRGIVKVETPETILPGEELTVRLACEGAAGTVPVLLAVRDQRLTATDHPSVSLGASLKKAVADATEGMDAGFFASDSILPPPPVARAAASPGFLRARAAEAVFEDTLDLEASGSFPMGAGGGDPVATELESESESDTETGPSRSDFPAVLFYGIVPVSGAQEIVFPAGDTLGSFAVEAFALVGTEWTDTRTTVVVDKPVRIDLEMPPVVHVDDAVVGRLRASTRSGQGRLRVTRDGEPVSPRSDRGGNDDAIETPVECELDVLPGTYVARVEDLETGETDSVTLTVGEPGVSKSYVKELGLLLAGDRITLDSSGALTLRVLPAVEEPFNSLITATAGYIHLCCEQTAAKILAATFMYLTSKNDGDRRSAEQIILAGVEREKKMLIPGKGFAMYPEYGSVNDHYSQLAVRYLWGLDRLREIPDIAPGLRRASREGLSLADEAAKAHGMKRAPKRIRSASDAYAAATDGNTRAAEKYFAKVLDYSGEEAVVQGEPGGVETRATLAYAAASFIAMGQLEKGVRLANRVTRQLNDQGCLYSTLDSVAAIVLMIQLRAAGLVSGQGRLRVNGSEMTPLEATALHDRVESIEVLEGVTAVEITRIHEQDWNSFEVGFPVRVGFRDSNDQRKDAFRMGDRAELVVSLPEGYRVGDLAHVSLPACLSWIRGGGKVKQFTMDFEGNDELRIPLIVTSTIASQQHFALCVRNMFEEERATTPGYLAVKAAGLGG